MTCPHCGSANPSGKKFCGDCGASLSVVPPGPSAAAPVSPADTSARKVVTIIFADLAGSTALHERLDAESARRLMERYYDALRTAVAAHRGTVVKLLGDGVMAAFGLRQVTEDDALRAVRAGVAMQDAFRALVRAQPTVLGAVGLRVAVNTGEVVVSGAHDDLIGDPVNIAARLQEQARDGDVVVGESTRRLVATRVTLAPLGAISLKGRAGSVAAYRLVSLDPPAATTAAPFVGRTDELARLDRVYDAAVDAPATRLALLLGSPGLGKSRLIDELSRRHADVATILQAHCDAAGGATFAPIAQAIRAFLGLDDGVGGDPARAAIAAAMAATTEESERARVAGGVAALLEGAPTSPEETFFAVRRFLAALGAAHPVVLVIDDLQWAEPLLLDLVEAGQRGRSLGGGRRARVARDAADDPCVAGGTYRAARCGRSRRTRARGGDRPSLLPQRHRRAARPQWPRARRPPRIAAAQRAHRARHRLVPGRAGDALPSRADPRRRVPPSPEGHPRRAARATRRLDRAPGE
ncbi:MAG TPA: adenylate/guanylate cyclase domain-containing protein [Candidatus Binatia bacterium]|jgi:class 3 adenylate cyclase|nr:adenylate/guanylate cyclase domain-containing protein [Candidatus Binatia bacterium]